MLLMKVLLLPLLFLQAQSQSNNSCSDVDEMYEVIQFRWTIRNFTSLVNKVYTSLPSPKFPSNEDLEMKWIFAFYQNRKADSLTVYICANKYLNKTELVNYKFFILRKDFDSSGKYVAEIKSNQVFPSTSYWKCWGHFQFLPLDALPLCITDTGNFDVFVQLERFRGPIECQEQFAGKASKVVPHKVLSITADHCTTGRGDKLETIEYTWSANFSDHLPRSPVLPSVLGNRFQWRLQLQKARSEDGTIQLYVTELKEENLPVAVNVSFTVTPNVNSHPPIQEKDATSVYTPTRNSYGFPVNSTDSNFKMYYTNSSNYFQIHISMTVFKYNVNCQTISPFVISDPHKKIIVPFQEIELTTNEPELENEVTEYVTYNKASGLVSNWQIKITQIFILTLLTSFVQNM